MNYKYLVLSDLHLGSSDSNPKKLLKFLKSHTFDNLILNGDIIDGWKIKRGGSLRGKEIDVLKYIIKLSKKINVVYVRGNHDDFLDNIIPIKFGNVEIVDKYLIEIIKDAEYISKRNTFSYQIPIEKYYVIHGDVFDKVTKELKWVAYIGDVGYSFLIKLNKLVNKYRRWRGKGYYSFSKQIKHKVKKAVNYISSFENCLVNLAKQKNYDGVICGHIHHPEIKEINGVMYYNSGDWVESMSALVYTDLNGWELIEYKENNE